MGPMVVVGGGGLKPWKMQVRFPQGPWQVLGKGGHGKQPCGVPTFGEQQGGAGVESAGFRVLCMDYEPAIPSFIQPVGLLAQPGLQNILARRGCSEGLALT